MAVRYITSKKNPLDSIMFFNFQMAMLKNLREEKWSFLFTISVTVPSFLEF